MLLTQILSCIWRVSWVKSLVLFVIFCPDFSSIQQVGACWPHSLEGYVPVRVNRLEEILRVKRAEIERLRARAKELERQARARNDFRDFRSALQQNDDKLGVIAEVKKASPSAGVIAESFDPVEIAKDYGRNLRRVYSYAT